MGGGRFPGMFRGGDVGGGWGGRFGSPGGVPGGGMFNGGVTGPGGTGGAFPTMSNPGAQPQPTPGNPMTGNTMPGNFGMLGQMFGGGANLANMNPALAMALQGKFNQGG